MGISEISSLLGLDTMMMLTVRQNHTGQVAGCKTKTKNEKMLKCLKKLSQVIL